MESKSIRAIIARHQGNHPSDVESISHPVANPNSGAIRLRVTQPNARRPEPMRSAVAFARTRAADGTH